MQLCIIFEQTIKMNYISIYTLCEVMYIKQKKNNWEKMECLQILKLNLNIYTHFRNDKLRAHIPLHQKVKVAFINNFSKPKLPSSE